MSMMGFFVYAQLSPKPEYIYDEYSEEWVNNLIAKMTKLNSNNNPDPKKVLLILDDCSSDHNFHQSKSLKQLFTRGRHLNISIIMTAQYIYQIPPICRNNADFVLVSQMNTQGLELLSTEFLMGNISKQQFRDIYNLNTRDYNFLLINNNSVKSNDDLNLIYGKLKCPNEFII